MSTKPNSKTKSPTRRPGRRAAPSTRRQRLTATAQTALPGSKRQTPQGGIHKLVAALGKTKEGAPFGGALGLGAAGVAAAAALLRRRQKTDADEQPTATAPSPSLEQAAADTRSASAVSDAPDPEVSAEPNAMPGEDDGDSHGSDPSAAA